jgi:hypothetical protein
MTERRYTPRQLSLAERLRNIADEYDRTKGDEAQVLYDAADALERFALSEKEAPTEQTTAWLIESPRSVCGTASYATCDDPKAWTLLVALEKKPWVRFDWTAAELYRVQKWINSFAYRTVPLKTFKPNTKRERYDAEQGLFV